MAAVVAARHCKRAYTGGLLTFCLSPAPTHLSGCHFAAIFLYPRDTSASVASSPTPRIR